MGRIFSEWRCIGGDIHPAVKNGNGPRILNEVIDQSDIEDRVPLGVNHDPFDIPAFPVWST